MSETVEQRRARLLSRDPVAVVIQTFVDSDMDRLEVVTPEPGTVIDGMVFCSTPDATPEKAYSRFYTIALRMGYLKDRVWVTKDGRSVWLLKTSEQYKAFREERKQRRKTV